MPSTDPSEVVIFASAWPQQPTSLPEDGEVIFAQAWPAEVLESAATAAARAEIDRLWADFDAEVSHVLSDGRCPYCDSFIPVDLAQPTVTCELCGGTWATYHAREGQA